MYIEMTTFAIPTFLIEIVKGFAFGVAVYVAIALIVSMFYRGN
jgi:uncharacterized membrane protein YdjX (TVP38/TMEM64 family)